ncbi:MAG: sialidase family protein, partial [Bdellovibrionia bacterium]
MLSALLCFLAFNIPGASAQPVVAFTSDNVDSRIQYNFGRSIAVGGGGEINAIHQVWVETTQVYTTTEVQGKIVYRLSPDGGKTWTPNKVLTQSIRTGYPKIAAYGPYVYVVYHESVANDVGVTSQSVKLLTSKQLGIDWHQSALMPVPTTVSACGAFPTVAAYANYFHVAVSCHDSIFKTAEVYYRGGYWNATSTAWLSDLKMVSYASYGTSQSNVGDGRSSWTPEIAVEGPDIYIAWTDERYNTVDCAKTNSDLCFEEVYLRRSHNLGQTWQPEQRITNSPRNIGHNASAIAVSNGTVHIALTRKPEPEWNVYYVRLTNKGADKQAEIPIAVGAPYYERPSIAAQGLDVQIAFHGITPGVGSKIYRTSSADGGKSFAPNVEIPNTLNFSYQVSIAMDLKGKTHLIFPGDT